HGAVTREAVPLRGAGPAPGRKSRPAPGGRDPASGRATSRGRAPADRTSIREASPGDGRPVRWSAPRDSKAPEAGDTYLGDGSTRRRGPSAVPARHGRPEVLPQLSRTQPAFLAHAGGPPGSGLSSQCGKRPRTANCPAGPDCRG